MNDEPVTTPSAAVLPDSSVTPPAEAPPRKPPHPGLRLLVFIVLIVAGGFIVSFVARQFGLRASKNLDQLPVPFMVISVLAVLNGLLANWIPIKRFERRPFRTVGFRLERSVWRDITLGLFTGALTPAIVALGFLAFGAATMKPVPVNWLEVTIPMAVAMALISSSEEIFLRGYFMQAIAEWGGPIIAAGISGLVFGLLHAGNPGANPMGLIITAVNGALLAYMMVRMGSLWLACAYHAGWNLIAAIGFGMGTSGMLSPGALASTELHGSAFWTGGSYGFEASVVSLVAEWFVLVALLKWGPRVVFDREAQPYFAMTKRPTEAPSEVSTR